MDFLARYFLTFLIFLPIMGTVVIRIVRKRAQAKWIALGSTLLIFLVSLLLLIFYDWRDPANSALSTYNVRDGAHPAGVVQFVQRITLVPPIHLEYFVGIDGLSLPLVLLTTFSCALICAASWNTEQADERYFKLLLLLEAAILATFLSLDFFFFFLFFALSLVPIGMLIPLAGGVRKRLARPKFVTFMLLSLICVLIGMFGVLHLGSSLDLVSLPLLLRQHHALGAGLHDGGTIFFAILLTGFLIRLAAVPLHTWLVDIHATATTPMSMMMGALIQTTAAYGIFRVAYALFPVAGQSLWIPIAAVAVGNIFYGALCAMRQTDLKRLAAFTLIPQAGIVLLGAAVMTPAGAYGATFMILSSGVTSAMLFVLIGVLSDREKQLTLSHLGGAGVTMPIYCGFSIVGFLAACGLPVVCTFVGQLLVLLGVFQAARSDSPLLSATHGGPAAAYTISILACIGLLLTSLSVLLALRRILIGPRRAESRNWPDLNQREIAVLTPLAVVAIALGILPSIVYFTFTRTTVDALQRWVADAVVRSEQTPR